MILKGYTIFTKIDAVAQAVPAAAGARVRSEWRQHDFLNGECSFSSDI